jgi:hypothetical protein
MITLPAYHTNLALTDWLEASVALGGRGTRITDTAILDVLAEADVEDAETLLTAVTQTVRWRSKTIRAGYPLKRDGLGFSARGHWSDFLPYSFMLFVSLNQFYDELNHAGGANQPAELFEFIVGAAVGKYLRCPVLRIGAPRRAPVPTAFPTALEYVVRQVNEALGSRDLEDQTSGDDGVDLIAWVPFGDGRESQVIVLLQCTIATRWGRKRDELSLKVWRRHIDWHSHPLQGFAVPFHHERGGYWRETATRAGIVFDRPRIARLLGRRISDARLSARVERWCRQRMRAMSRLDIGG